MNTPNRTPLAILLEVTKDLVDLCETGLTESDRDLNWNEVREIIAEAEKETEKCNAGHPLMLTLLNRHAARRLSEVPRVPRL